MLSSSTSTPNILNNNNNNVSTGNISIGGASKNKSNQQLSSGSRPSLQAQQQQPQPPPLPPLNTAQQQPLNCNDLSSPLLTNHYSCSRYYLFIVYLSLLITIILNTFINFIFYGTNMSIASIFLDVHHRYDLYNGHLNHYYNYYYNDNRLKSFINNPFNDNKQQQPYYRCDRNSFLSLLDEFYHSNPLPKAGPDGKPQDPVDIDKSYPKLFRNFDNYATRPNGPRNRDRINNNNEDNIYYSSNKDNYNDYEENIDNGGGAGVAPNGRYDDNEPFVQTSRQRSSWNSNFESHGGDGSVNGDSQNGLENRVLAIEIIALISLFIIILNQVLGLIGVIRKNIVILIIVTIVNFILFSIFAFISNFGLIILLLLATSVGYLFIYQLKIGIRQQLKQRLQFKQDLSTEIQDGIIQMRNRMSPCIHVSMEQYEQMTQQMLNRYSSPIVYCPHYNESLC